ncbi:MAG: DUF2167 domain-containing protein [Limisphaerales bacterium]
MFLALPGYAQTRVTSRAEALKIINGLKYQQGEIPLRGGLAKLNVPPEFNYLGPDDAQTVLVRLWGNPPGEKPLGMLMPTNTTPLDKDCWVVTISFAEDGYVKDGDANKINYDDLLKKMQKAAQEANVERKKKGYDTAELIGWAAPPRYDAVAHKLYWAKELKFGNAAQDTLNYNIRMLGRRGVLVLNAIASMDQLSAIEAQTPTILGMVNFNDGNRYADFDPKADKVATYGLAALVAGGIAAKLGLFKMLFVFLLAIKKFVIIGFIAVAAWCKKLFSKTKKTTT